MNFRIWPKNQSQFWWRHFFFLATTWFWAEKTFEIPISAEKSVSISVKTSVFEDHLILGGKNVWISDFGRKISLNFGEDLFFFFWRPPDFGRKKRLNFWACREISSQFSDKPCETDSRTMKIRVKVVCTFLTLSKKPPPLFQILATRLGWSPKKCLQFRKPPLSATFKY